MNVKLFILFTILYEFTSSLVQGQLCPNTVKPLLRNPNIIPSNKQWVLFKVICNPNLQTLAEVPTCTYAYFQVQGQCGAVIVNFHDYFVKRCSNQGSVSRFFISGWGQFVDTGNFMFLAHELESADRFLEIYRTKQVIVKKATIEKMTAVDLKNPDKIINYYNNLVLAIIGAGRHFIAFQICNSKTTSVIIFATTDVFDDQKVYAIKDEIENFMKRHFFNVYAYETLTGVMDVDPSGIKLPAMSVDKTGC